MFLCKAKQILNQEHFQKCQIFGKSELKKREQTGVSTAIKQTKTKKLMKKQEYTYSKVHLWKDKNKSDSEMWHLFPSHSCSPGDLAAKEKEKEEGCAMRILSLKSSDGEMMN